MLAWIGLLDFAAGTGGFTPTPTPEPTGKRRGSPRRKKQWWEDGFYLPPHRRIEKDEPLPHEAAIEDARETLAETRKMRAASQTELRKLAGKFGSIVRTAKAVEKKIEQATDVIQVEQEYRELGATLSAYVDQLEALKEKKRQRLIKDDEMAMSLVMKLLMNEAE